MATKKDKAIGTVVFTHVDLNTGKLRRETRHYGTRYGAGTAIAKHCMEGCRVRADALTFDRLEVRGHRGRDAVFVAAEPQDDWRLVGGVLAHVIPSHPIEALIDSPPAPGECRYLGVPSRGQLALLAVDGLGLRQLRTSPEGSAEYIPVPQLIGSDYELAREDVHQSEGVVWDPCGGTLYNSEVREGSIGGIPVALPFNLHAETWAAEHAQYYYVCLGDTGVPAGAHYVATTPGGAKVFAVNRGEQATRQPTWDRLPDDHPVIMPRDYWQPVIAALAKQGRYLRRTAYLVAASCPVYLIRKIREGMAKQSGDLYPRKLDTGLWVWQTLAGGAAPEIEGL